MNAQVTAEVAEKRIVVWPFGPKSIDPKVLHSFLVQIY